MYLKALLPMILALSSAALSVNSAWPPNSRFRGARLIGLSSLEAFTVSKSANAQQRVFVSPEIDPLIPWDELIVSWNVELPADGKLKVEARAIYTDHVSSYYTMGLWSGDTALNPRQSVKKQKDAAAEVQTDTLVLKKPALRVQVRLTLERARPETVRLLGLCFADTKFDAPPLRSDRSAWGRVLDVPELSQLGYEGGRGWCSPTATCMAINYWASKLGNPALKREVPAVAAGVHDPNWPGTGNWPFNTAYAGGLPGIRAYVSRLTDLTEIEDWIAAGVPVIMSVLPRLLTGSDSASQGHLIVAVGFTEVGDLVANDPWARLDKGQSVRRIYKRTNAAAAWAASNNTVYLIYPKTLAPPRDRFGHWDVR